LMEDTKFPGTKTELISKQGWKIIDLTGDRWVHAQTLLENLPEKEYRNIEEVIGEFPETLE